MIPLAPFYADEALFLALNGLARNWLDYFCGWPTYFGDPWVITLSTFAYMLIWDRRPLPRKIGMLASATFGAWFAAGALKLLVFRPRPYLYFLDRIENGTTQIHALFGLLQQESAFPSAHTAAAFAAAAVLTRFYGWALSPMVFGMAAFVGFTRIYVGVHYPSDVAAGALLGALIGEMAWRVGGPKSAAETKAF